MHILLGLTNVVAIARGANHNLVLQTDNTLVSWSGTGTNQMQAIKPAQKVVAIAAAGINNLILTEDGTVLGWNWDFSQSIPVPSGLNHIRAIAASPSHFLALHGDAESFQNPFRWTELKWDYGQFHSRLSGPPGQIGMLEGSTNLWDWIPLRLTVIPPLGWFDFCDPDSISWSKRFYRVRRAP